MSNEAAVSAQQNEKEKKGKFAWTVPFLEVVIVIGYLILGWGAISDFISSFDLGSLFEDIMGAIYFLIGGTIVTTIMCFIPAFKSRNNMYIAVWNIVWLGFNIFGLLGN